MLLKKKKNHMSLMDKIYPKNSIDYPDLDLFLSNLNTSDIILINHQAKKKLKLPQKKTSKNLLKKLKNKLKMLKL
jgi:hypothetical protein